LDRTVNFVANTVDSAVFDKIHHIVHIEVDFVASVYATLRAYCDKLACVTDIALDTIQYDRRV